MDGTGRRLHSRWTRRSAAILAMLIVAGCSTRVSTYTPSPSTATDQLPRPTRVLVADFAIDPSSVQQDQGVSLRLQRQFSGANQDSARNALATEVQSAIGDTLVADLTKAGLPAQRVAAGASMAPGDLYVTGTVQRIDEGNRTRRVGIGFGAGKSIVEGTAELYTITASGLPVLLQRYDGSADSGHMPGMAVGAASAVSQSSAVTGVISGVSNVGGEVRRSPVGKEAARLGSRLATDISQYAAKRGWIPEASVPRWTR